LSSVGLAGFDFLGLELGLDDTQSALATYEAVMRSPKLGPLPAELKELHQLCASLATGSHSGIAEHNVSSALARARQIFEEDDHAENVQKLIKEFIQAVEEDPDKESESDSESECCESDNESECDAAYPLVVAIGSHEREGLVRLPVQSKSKITALHMTGASDDDDEGAPRKKSKTGAGVAEPALPARVLKPAQTPDVLLIETKDGQLTWPLINNQCYLTALGKRAGFNLVGKLTSEAGSTSLGNWLPNQFRQAKDKKLLLEELDPDVRSLVKAWAGEWVRPTNLQSIFTGTVFAHL
jgi:hypothetical protein